MPDRKRPLPDWVIAERHRVGARLRAARQARQISQEALALRCGLDRKTIYRIELGQRSPLLDHLLLIAAVLDVEPSAPFRDGDPM